MLPEQLPDSRAGSPQDAALENYKDALRERFPLEDVIRAASRRRCARRAVAGVVVCAAAGLSAWFADPAYRSEQFDTATGEHRIWSLADGSRLALDTGTSARMEWHVRSRRLVVAQGEVLIEVASSVRPFSTRAGDTMIYDIGTAFSVRRDADAVRIGVIEGAVNVVAGAHDELTLHPDQAVEVTANRIGAVKPFDTRAALNRREGRLAFDGTPLGVAVVELRRYRTAPVRIEDNAKSLRLSGEFDAGNVDALLDMLPHVLPLTVFRAPDGAVTIAHR